MSLKLIKFKNHPQVLFKLQSNRKYTIKNKKALKRKIGKDVEDFGIRENGLDKWLKHNARKEKDNGRKRLMNK